MSLISMQIFPAQILRKSPNGFRAEISDDFYTESASPLNETNPRQKSASIFDADTYRKIHCGNRA